MNWHYYYTRAFPHTERSWLFPCSVLQFFPFFSKTDLSKICPIPSEFCVTYLKWEKVLITKSSAYSYLWPLSSMFISDCSTGKCRPVCRQGCEPHGTCVEPDQCLCHFGYVGDNCSTECKCNKHSDCYSVDQKDECLKCHNNTMVSFHTVPHQSSFSLCSHLSSPGGSLRPMPASLCGRPQRWRSVWVLPGFLPRSLHGLLGRQYLPLGTQTAQSTPWPWERKSTSW